MGTATTINPDTPMQKRDGPKQSLRQWLADVTNALEDFQEVRARDALYPYLRPYS
jgi:hypothetical protein